MIFAGASAKFSCREDRALRGRTPSARHGGEDGAAPAPFSPHSIRFTSFPRKAKNPVRLLGGHLPQNAALAIGRRSFRITLNCLSPFTRKTHPHTA